MTERTHIPRHLFSICLSENDSVLVLEVCEPDLLASICFNALMHCTLLLHNPPHFCAFVLMHCTLLLHNPPHVYPFALLRCTLLLHPLLPLCYVMLEITLVRNTADLSCNKHCRAQCKKTFPASTLIGWDWDGSAMLSSAHRKWLWIGPGQLQGNAIRLELGKV